MLQITISKRAAFIALLAVLLVIPVAALATHVFDDVGDTSTHIDGITFMKDSGVSIGCDANNNFCPDDSVTRAQMGTFMYRLSGNDPATDPSVNAATLDDGGPLAYTTQIDGMSCIEAGGCDDVTVEFTPTSHLELPVSVPADGVLAVSYTFSQTSSPAGTNPTQVWLTLDDSSCGGWFFFPTDSIDGTYSHAIMDSTITWASYSGQATVAATTGDHTLTLCSIATGDPTETTMGQITSIWSATGSP